MEAIHVTRGALEMLRLRERIGVRGRVPDLTSSEDLGDVNEVPVPSSIVELLSDPLHYFYFRSFLLAHQCGPQADFVESVLQFRRNTSKSRAPIRAHEIVATFSMMDLTHDIGNWKSVLRDTLDSPASIPHPTTSMPEVSREEMLFGDEDGVVVGSTDLDRSSGHSARMSRQALSRSEPTSWVAADDLAALAVRATSDDRSARGSWVAAQRRAGSSTFSAVEFGSPSISASLPSQAFASVPKEDRALLSTGEASTTSSTTSTSAPAATSAASSSSSSPGDCIPASFTPTMREARDGAEAKLDEVEKRAESAPEHLWSKPIDEGVADSALPVPLALLRAFRRAKLRRRSAEDVWVSVSLLLARGAPPAELFDELLVLVVDEWASVVAPIFAASPLALEAAAAARVVEKMQHPPTPRDFLWCGRLGRGGYGSVHACVHNASGRMYAVKKMDKRLVKSRNAGKLIMLERNVLATIDNPFVTGLRYAFQDEGYIYLALDISGGGDLEQHLVKRGPMAEPAVKFIIAQVVLGVKHLHERGIIHRDIKPANILLDDQGHASLSDLGLASYVSSATLERLFAAVEAAAGRPATGRSLAWRGQTFRRHSNGTLRVNGMVVRPYTRGKAGTPGFWAPEMLHRDDTGRAGKYDGAVDWWSVGCLMYAMLVGRGPFTVRGGDTDDDNNATLTLEPTRPRGAMSDDAWRCIQYFLRKDPERRLGARGADEVMAHPWFEDVEWPAIEAKESKPPYHPATLGQLRLDQKPHPKDVAREAKLASIRLDESDHVEGLEFVSKATVQRELMLSATCHGIERSLAFTNKLLTVASATTPRSARTAVSRVGLLTPMAQGSAAKQRKAAAAREAAARHKAKAEAKLLGKGDGGKEDEEEEEEGSAKGGGGGGSGGGGSGGGESEGTSEVVEKLPRLDHRPPIGAAIAPIHRGPISAAVVPSCGGSGGGGGGGGGIGLVMPTVSMPSSSAGFTPVRTGRNAVEVLARLVNILVGKETVNMRTLGAHSRAFARIASMAAMAAPTSLTVPMENLEVATMARDDRGVLSASRAFLERYGGFHRHAPDGNVAGTAVSVCQALSSQDAIVLGEQLAAVEQIMQSASGLLESTDGRAKIHAAGASVVAPTPAGTRTRTGKDAAGQLAELASSAAITVLRVMEAVQKSTPAASDSAATSSTVTAAIPTLAGGASGSAATSAPGISTAAKSTLASAGAASLGGPGHSMPGRPFNPDEIGDPTGGGGGGGGGDAGDGDDGDVTGERSRNPGKRPCVIM